MNDLKSAVVSGTINLTPTNPPRPAGRYVFQRVAPGLGNVAGAPNDALQLRRHVVPLDPKTLTQRARRAVMRWAVYKYRQASAAVRAAAQPHADRKKITLFNGWISSWSENHPLRLRARWDAGTSEWDNGASLWDVMPGTLWDAGITTWDAGTSLWDIMPGTLWDAGATEWDNGASLWDVF